MSAKQQPVKPIALEAGRVPAQPSQVVRQLCGRVPVDSESKLVNFGRVPNEIPNTLLAQPANSVRSIAQASNNNSQNVAAARKPSSESSPQKTVSLISRRATH
ncbi:MAG: hypothetical protein ABSE16_06790 [Verrucomicrobiota bacterium]|jgi:hypothetical protein